MTPEDVARKTAAGTADRARWKANGPSRCRWRPCHRRRLPLCAGRPRRRARARQRRQTGCRRRQLPVQRAGTLSAAAVLFPDSRRCRQPRLADEAGLHRRDHLWQSAGRDSAGRRPHLRPAPGAGRVARIGGQSADRAGDRQSHLEPSFRTGDRRDAWTTSARWARSRRIPNCSTGWRWSSCTAGGASSRCTG